MKKLIILVLIFLLTIFSYARQKPEKKEIESLSVIEKESHITLKTFIPGVYQLSKGKLLKGTLILGSEIFFITFGASLLYMSSKAYDEYLDMDNDNILDTEDPRLDKEVTLKDFDEKIKFSNDTWQLSQACFIIAGGIYAYSFVNAFFSAGKTKKNVSFNTSEQGIATPCFSFRKEKKIALCYTKEF